MSNGGGESGREHAQLHTKRKFGGNDFAHAIAKIAVAQICESAGFQTFQQSALETLSDVAVRYIHHTGKNANLYANLAGRTEGNIFDVIQGLEDLGSGLGFAGAADIDHCLASSGIVRDLIHYVGKAEDIPFAYSIPRFPVVKDWKSSPSFLQMGEEPPEEHIPGWLPAFPSPQTYAQLERGNERVNDSQKDKVQPARQQRNIGSSSLKLQHFAWGRIEGASLADNKDAAKAKQVAEVNPFLAAPLQYGEKEVSPVVLPTKLSNEVAMKNPIGKNHVASNHVPVLETFAPAIEAMKSKLCDSEEGQGKELLNRRPLVQFNIGIARKSLRTALDLSLENKSMQKIAPWFGKDEEKDDKKRRAEKILKESMEKMQELAQL